jgi:hypothetical protein
VGTSSGGAGVGGTTTVGDAAVPRWCDTQHVLFCEDFDGAPNVEAFLDSWTSSSTTGATFSFDQSGSVPSPPHALRIRTTSPSDVLALVIHSIPKFATPPSKLRLGFELRIDAGDTIQLGSGVAFAAILAGTRATDRAIAAELGVTTGPVFGAGWVDTVATTEGDDSTPAFPVENQWLGRYTLEVTYSSTASGVRAGCVQLLLEEQPQLAKCLKLPASLIDPPVVSVAFGVASGGLAQNGDVQLRFDNVTFTAE